MRSTIVPAQITTVEDRIFGNLGVHQLLLLAIPVFAGSTLYAILPPFLHSSPYKLAIISALLFICVLLSIRIKGKLIFFWLITVLRYNLRSRYYVFDKNTDAHRMKYEVVKIDQAKDAATAVKRKVLEPINISVPDLVRLQAIIDNPAANMTFKTDNKGGLSVFVTEIKD